MNRRANSLGLAYLLLGLMIPVAGQGKTDPQQELKLLQGTWKVVTLEIDGKPQPADKTPKEFVISGNKLTGIGPEMMLTVDPTKKPKWIDLTFKKEDKDYPTKTIYELDGDNLKLGIPLATVGELFKNERPESFETKGKPLAVFTAKRASK